MITVGIVSTVRTRSVFAKIVMGCGLGFAAVITDSVMVFVVILVRSLILLPLTVAVVKLGTGDRLGVLRATDASTGLGSVLSTSCVVV